MIDSSGTPPPPDSSDEVTTSIAASLTGRRQRLEQSPSYQGTTFMLNFDWGIAEYPLDANCKAAMQIRKDIKAEDVICEATTENGKIIISLIENRIKIKQEIRKKWRVSDNFTAQLTLYRLCSTTEEHRLLNNTASIEKQEEVKEKSVVILPVKDILNDDNNGVE